MIDVERAARLQAAGLRWTPSSGDRFTVTSPELEGEVFTISDMTIEPRHYSTGTVLGFNGTTEWALDSVAQDDALWLPSEGQLRELLGGTFRSLARGFGETYQVVIEITGRPAQSFTADTVVDAYADALFALLSLATADVERAAV